MAKDNETIKKEIEDFKANHGGAYSDYYIGITNNLERRLIEDNSKILEHKSSGKYKEGDPYYSIEANSRADAVEIEQYFQNKGMKGFNPASKGIEESKFIYCFKISEEHKSLLEKIKYKMKYLINYNSFK